MQCLNPLKSGYDYNGNITRNKHLAIKALHFNCRKCLPCRLNIAKEKAIRAWHESQMHENNIFLTLTYDEEKLTSDRLVYSDWQNFMKLLRKTTNNKLPVMVTGEYGDPPKMLKNGYITQGYRPHWHALIFNYRPADAVLDRNNDRGEQLFTSECIKSLWNRGNHDFGSVTIDSANYVARYAAKKLVHGRDCDHDYHPKHRTSSKYGLGRSWIEKHYKHTFENGFVVLPNGATAKIPRYYIDWCKINKPMAYRYYVTEVAPELQKQAELKSKREEFEYFSELWSRQPGDPRPITRNDVKHTILKSKFKKLQERLKI